MNFDCRIYVDICCDIDIQKRFQIYFLWPSSPFLGAFQIFTHVKIIIDSLTRQREHSTYSKRSTQCSPTIISRLRKKVLIKDYLRNTDTFTYKKGINTQLCTTGKTFPPSRYICTLKV